MQGEQAVAHRDFPGFEELKNLPGSDTPYIFSVTMPQVRGHFRLLKMGSIAISEGEMELSEDVPEYVSMKHLNDLPLVEMNFSLEGHIRQKLGFLKDELIFTKGYHNIMYNHGEWEHNHFLRGGRHNTFTINVHADRFIQLFSAHSSPMDDMATKVMRETPFLLEQPKLPFTPYMHAIIQSFWHCSLTGGLKSLYVETKMMELLLLQWSLLTQAASSGSVLKSKTDVEKIHWAREILLKDLQHPPSLAQLARQCGLNEFKLKKGFKEIFSDTVFGYFASVRLEQARQLLLHTGKTVSEIAYESGFTHPQHFQRAFKKQFGIAPGQLRK